MPNSSLEAQTFEKALEELEQIVRKLEDGALGLEESLDHYEKGVKLLRRCYTQLQEVEQRIVELTGLDEQGRPVTRPFDHISKMESVKNDGPTD
jgi:exodeoxyribonuclease VII small subunit